MKTVITYGTFDLLHEGHINILRRAKKLGDYLIVGLTSDEYDRYRGKLNVSQSLSERIDAVSSTGFADKIIVENYEGQKIEDIKKYNVDTIVLGSDWTGKIDYLKRYCNVVYLPRTENISSTLLRSGGKIFRVGIMADYPFTDEDIEELKLVSGVDINCCYTPSNDFSHKRDIKNFWGDKTTFLQNCDILFIDSCAPDLDEDLRTFITAGKHILAPHLLGLNSVTLAELSALSQANEVLFIAAPPFLNLNTYVKLINIALSGAIGTVLGIELSMTSAQAPTDMKAFMRHLGSICLLPVFQLLGWDVLQSRQQSYENEDGIFTVLNIFTKEGFARVKFAKNINMECRCIIQGTRAYIKVPVPWWNSDYFELRYSSGKIRKFSWPASGKAIRYQLADFVKTLFQNNYHLNTHTGNVMQQILKLDRATENIFNLCQQ